MADNDLESFLRADNYELIQSSAIREPNLFTSVYFDGRNYGTGEDIREPLREVYTPNGDLITVKNTGSSVLRWNHEMNKMIRIAFSDTELNSDNFFVINGFIRDQLEYCVGQGTTEYIIVFSSHGSGFYGFGGDEHTERQRSLQVANNYVVLEAMRMALADVEGAPDKFDVVGFDACLMMSIGALDEYRDVAKYYLASMATEPGHGWAYRHFNSVDSALNIALDLHRDYIERKQGFGTHLTPKTLAIVNTDLFTVFLNAWEALFAEITNLIMNDRNFFTILNRARLQTISFDGALDGVEQQATPSAMDIGDFMNNLRSKCIPSASSSFHSLLLAAQDTYEAMFVANGVSPGTKSATGMHVTFLTRRQFRTLTEYGYDLDILLFNTEFAFATEDAPNFLNFMQAYYAASKPADNGVSVCAVSIDASTQPTEDGILLINPQVTASNGTVFISTEITAEVDEVFVEYGVDISSYYFGLRRNRRSLLDESQKAEVKESNWRKMFSRRLKFSNGSTRRKLNEEEYFIFFGGDLVGSYAGPVFTTEWDTLFTALEDTDGNFIPIYVFDFGEGSKAIPVLFFRDEVTSDQVESFISEFDAIDAGGEYAFITYSILDDDMISDIVLFTNSADGTTYSETPPSAGGYIVPVNFVEGVADGSFIDIFVGGLNNTIIEWSVNNTVSVNLRSAEFYLDALDLDTLIIDIVAFDDDAEVAHFETFDVTEGISKPDNPDDKDDDADDKTDTADDAADDNADNVDTGDGKNMTTPSGAFSLLSQSIVNVFCVLVLGGLLKDMI